MLLFASKKVYKTACIMYRNLWESCEKVCFQRESFYNDYMRLSGTINGFRYQIHINAPEIAGRFRDLNEHSDTDNQLIRIFAVACSCADYGQFYKDFKHLSKSLVLNA